MQTVTNVSSVDTCHRLLDIKQVRGSPGFLEDQLTGMCATWGDISGSILAGMRSPLFLVTFYSLLLNKEEIPGKKD